MNTNTLARPTICPVCEKGLTAQDREHTNGIDSGLCAVCYDEAGWENEHSDGYHEGQPHAECPACRAEAEAEEVEAVAPFDMTKPEIKAELEATTSTERRELLQAELDRRVVNKSARRLLRLAPRA